MNGEGGGEGGWGRWGGACGGGGGMRWWWARRSRPRVLLLLSARSPSRNQHASWVLDNVKGCRRVGQQLAPRRSTQHFGLRAQRSRPRPAREPSFSLRATTMSNSKNSPAHSRGLRTRSIIGRAQTVALPPSFADGIVPRKKDQPTFELGPALTH